MPSSRETRQAPPVAAAGPALRLPLACLLAALAALMAALRLPHAPAGSPPARIPAAQRPPRGATEALERLAHSVAAAQPSPSASTSAAPSRMETLRAELDQRGANTSACRVAAFTGGLRGLAAVRDLQPGAVIAAVPLGAALSAATFSARPRERNACAPVRAPPMTLPAPLPPQAALPGCVPRWKQTLQARSARRRSST